MKKLYCIFTLMLCSTISLTVSAAEAATPFEDLEKAQRDARNLMASSPKQIASNPGLLKELKKINQRISPKSPESSESSSPESSERRLSPAQILFLRRTRTDKAVLETIRTIDSIEVPDGQPSEGLGARARLAAERRTAFKPVLRGISFWSPR